MNTLKNTGFADRLNAAAEAKKAQLERAARAKAAADSPEAAERRAARQAIGNTGVFEAVHRYFFGSVAADGRGF